MAQHGFSPYGSRGVGRGPIGEVLLDRGVRLTPAEVSAQLAAARVTETAVGEVVEVDFSQHHVEDYAPVAEQV